MMSRSMNAIMTVLLLTTTGLAAPDVFAPMRRDDARSRTLTWSATQPGLGPAQQQQIGEIWTVDGESDEPDRVLDLVIRSMAVANADAARLVTSCNAAAVELTPPETGFLSQGNLDPFFTSNLGLFYGRFLVERRLFDEALEVLHRVDPQAVVDPASLFFFRAVAQQALLEVKPALQSLETLLKNVERVPVRYSAVAALMQADLQTYEEKSLGEIARLMSDSERRLDLGRAGEKVQGVQERIISELDEIIKKIEQQQGGGGGGGDGSGSSNQSNAPAADSSVKGSEAPGEVDKKKFSKDGQWGNLPAREQAKAKSDLTRNFPSHYQRAIDQYFRKQSERTTKTR